MKKNLAYYINTVKLKLAAKSYRNSYDSVKNKELRASLKNVNKDVLGEWKAADKTLSFAPLFTSFLYEDQEELLAYHISQSDKQKNNPLQGFLIALIRSNLFFASENDLQKQLFLKGLDEANQKAENINGHLAFKYPTPFKKYELPAGWVSGICQGLACSANLRAYHITKNNEYLELAKSYIRFTENVENGLKINGPLCGVWIEEYPSTPSSFVLNGFLFYLISILELEALTKENWNANTYVESFLNHLHLFTYKNHILYDLLKKEIGNVLYQNIHKKQLEHLSILTNFNGFNTLNNLTL